MSIRFIVESTVITKTTVLNHDDISDVSTTLNELEAKALIRELLNLSDTADLEVAWMSDGWAVNWSTTSDDSYWDEV